MATDAVRLNITSTVTGQGFRMACLTLSTHFLQSFFCKSRVPLGPTAVKAKVMEVHLVEAAKGPGEGCRCRGAGLTNSLILVLVILRDFFKGRYFATSMRINPCNPWRFSAHFNEMTKYLSGHVLWRPMRH